MHRVADLWPFEGVGFVALDENLADGNTWE
jgi:hypothetical protein